MAWRTSLSLKHWLVFKTFWAWQHLGVSTPQTHPKTALVHKGYVRHASLAGKALVTYVRQEFVTAIVYEDTSSCCPATSSYKKSYRTRTTFVTILVYAYHTCVTTTFRVSNICGALLKILLAKKNNTKIYTAYQKNRTPTISMNFTNSQHLLIIFGTETLFNLNWLKRVFLLA